MASNEYSPVLRLTFLTVLIMVLFIALFSRLWFLQVLSGERYLEASDTNRLRTVVTEAPRGRILAADGRPLVENRWALTISADRQQLLTTDGLPRDEVAEQVIARLAVLLRLPEEEVLSRLTSRRYSPFRPVPIAVDVAPEVVFAVREQQELFPGVLAESLPVRTYPQGTAAAHLVGYLGEISEAELLDPAFTDYRGGDMVGRGGLEESYEAELRGIEGQRVLEVTARGTVVGTLSEREPAPGNDLRTHLDLDLQVAVERLLADGIVASRDILRDDGRFLPSTGGSAIVLDATDGRVLAMASYPSYDPREFVGGVSQTYWAEINDPDNNTPLFHRPIQATHPPGSVFKTVSGAAMLTAGLVTPDTELACPPFFEVGGITFRNWNPLDEGEMDLATALMRSCDTYFYDLAYRQWLREEAQGDEPDEILPRIAADSGFGQRLGIDLPNEAAGVVPSRAWRQNYWERFRAGYCANAERLEPGTYGQLVNEDLCLFGGRWRGGDAINTSIGQGDLLTTPLQVAAHYQALAADGLLYRPHLGAEVVAPDGTVLRRVEPEVVASLELEPGELAAIRRGLERTVMDERGTAFSGFEGFPLRRIPVAGKTGTAELKPLVPFAWFAAYAPANAPEVVVVVNVEEGGGGAQTAVPIARGILEHHFGITPAERYVFRAGPEQFD